MSADAPWHFDQLRIADFYLVFFFRLGRARLSPKHRAIRNLAKSMGAERYEMQPDDQLIFSRMEKTQRAAMGALLSSNFFDSEQFLSGILVEGLSQETQPLSIRLDEANKADSRLLGAIHSLVTEYDLLGADGIKARTGLMEHRYDAT